MSLNLDGQKTLFSGREILTPASLADKLQGCFDRDFGQVWVEGEISELSRPHSGHAYFCLKERVRGQDVRLKAVMWKGRRPYAGAALSEGLSVLAKGRLAVYAPRGDYQLVVDYLEPLGEGALRLAFEKLEAKLKAEGIFEAGRKRPLPFWPARVAVISSPSGAAVRDFMRGALSRRPGAAISLYPVRVQGEGAAAEIARAIEDLNVWGGFDLIVLTRGGGSLSDLWAFNEEAVVRAVAASRTPILAAIGHSTDLSLAELAADQRAMTPTAAAERIYRDQAAFLEHLAESEKRLCWLMDEALIRRRERLADLSRRQGRSLINLYSRRQEALTDLSRRLGRFEDRLGLAGQRLDELSRRLDWAIGRRLDGWERRLEILSSRLKILSPVSVLRRGYALVSREGDERPLTRADELRIGDKVAVRLAQGRFTAEVKVME